MGPGVGRNTRIAVLPDGLNFKKNPFIIANGNTVPMAEGPDISQCPDRVKFEKKHCPGHSI